MKTNNNQPIKQDFFNQIANQFDKHVRESIPLFSECIDNIRHNIVKYHAYDRILDICGSTGKIGVDLFKQGFRGSYTNIDGSPQMIDIAKKLEAEQLNGHICNNVLGGFMCGWSDNGIDIPHIDTKGGCYDITMEILGFQFFTKEREAQILELKKSSISGGVHIFVEKFSNSNAELWKANEELKDRLHKSKYFTVEQIEQKKSNVLVDMGEYCYDYDAFVLLLIGLFPNVKRIYHAGNFAAYVCSDTSIKWDVNVELIDNVFNA